MLEVRKYVAWLGFVCKLGAKAPLFIEKIEQIVAIIKEITEMFPELPVQVSANATMLDEDYPEFESLGGRTLEENVCNLYPVEVTGIGHPASSPRMDGHRLRNLYAFAEKYHIIQGLSIILPFLV